VVLRRIGAGGVLAIDERGNTVRVSASQWRHAPRIVGSIDLPEGYRRTRGTTREILDRLARFRPDGGRRRQAHAPTVSDVERAAAAHPVAACPDVAEHRRWAERADRLRRETDALEDKVGRRTSTLSRTFARVLEIMELHGYVNDDSITDRGERLCRIYNESDLLVAEALERGVFDDLNAAELAAAVSALVFDARGVEEEFSWPAEKVRRAYGTLARLYKRIHEHEQQRGVELVREPDPGFVEQVYWWAKDEPLDQVLAMSERSAGDFVRSTKQVWDLLKQLAEVAHDDASAKRFREAGDAIYRGVVAYAGAL
jgi:ATP-dependent RNA helicase HelY